MTGITKKIGSFLKFDTWGFLATASFLVCAISGVFLAVPYDVNNPFDSIAKMLLTNPGAVFLRNAHYWSAQLFLIFTILHTWEYLKSGNTQKVKTGIWLRLVVSLIFVFYVMISGFILKGDMDSMQARNIIRALAESIPLVGSLLAYTLIGKNDSLQILYVHHIATASIFLTIIIIEHAKTIWVKSRTFFIVVLIVSGLSVLFRAPLHNNLTPVVKGPWYFLGLQEILHWMANPGWLLLILTGFLVIVYFIPGLKQPGAQLFRRAILYAFYFYLGLTVIAYFFRGEDWSWDWRMQEVYNPFEIHKSDLRPLPDSLIQIMANQPDEREGCVICHHNMKGFTTSHDPQAVGCLACHLGDPYTLDKDAAHRNMVKIPGNLSDASRTCGTAGCHPEIALRIQNTMMTTLSGIVSVDRFVFEEIKRPGELSRITEIGHSPADRHLRDMCANCHLGNPKTEYGPITELSRGGGCNACHLNHPGTDRLPDENYIPGITVHPQLSLEVTNDHCFGCHSRSGRISTNYEGWHETKLEIEDVANQDQYRQLEDQRIFEFVGADVHHESGMDCIDCHNSYELMGDGNLYMHEEYQVKIQCEDCHFHGDAETLIASQLDSESRKIHDLRKYPDGRRFLKVKKSGVAMLNAFQDTAGGKWLVTKNSVTTLPMIPPAPECNRGEAHNDLSCNACHTAWAPQCIGCHNSYEPNEAGYDLLDNKHKTGTWVEYAGVFLAEPPVLGVDERKEINGGQSRSVATFINGMVLSIDIGSFDGQESRDIFHRLYAPVSAHTTTRQGRSCKSCHNDPLAIGYGRGMLEYKIKNHKGRWQFTPRFAANKYDGLPEDAWIGYLAESTGWTATREGVRPFSVAEQKQILTVGACLTCHADKSEVMQESLKDFGQSLKKTSEACVLPEW
jgi:hypothetical protein